jgi:hypothetical protein
MSVAETIAADASEAVSALDSLASVAAYAAIGAAWAAYRRSQEIPWPAIGGGEVLKAQSRLHHLAEGHACGRPDGEPDLEAIRAAAEDLAAKVRRYCGDDAADYVNGTEGEIGNVA